MKKTTEAPKVPESKPITPKDNPKDEWTLRKGAFRTGDDVSLAQHRVIIGEFVRSTDSYDVFRVKVLGPITMDANGNPFSYTVPPLRWGKQLWDTEGKFTPQRMV